MSHFSEALRRVLDKHNMRPLRLAQDADLAASTVHMYLRANALPTPEKLATILKTLPASEHSGLIIARLRDDIPAGYDTTVVLLTRSDAVSEPRDGTSYSLPAELSEELRAAIEHLSREAVRLQEVRELLIDLARALRAERGNDQADSRDGR